jgi:predicted nuclease of predicted toxin-antitoxin system
VTTSVTAEGAVKLLADECCKSSLVSRLRAAGHDVLWVAQGDAGISDEEVLDAAFRAGRVVITDDKDFGELVIRQKRQVVGLVLLRFTDTSANAAAERLVRLLALSENEIAGQFVVLSRQNAALI